MSFPPYPIHNTPVTNQQILMLIENQASAIRKELKANSSPKEDCNFVLNKLVEYLKKPQHAANYYTLEEVEDKIRKQLNNVELVKFNKGLRSMLQAKTSQYQQLREQVAQSNASASMQSIRANPKN